MLLTESKTRKKRIVFFLIPIGRVLEAARSPVANDRTKRPLPFHKPKSQCYSHHEQDAVEGNRCAILCRSDGRWRSWRQRTWTCCCGCCRIRKGAEVDRTRHLNMEFGLAQLQLAWNLASWMSFILDVDGALI